MQIWPGPPFRASKTPYSPPPPSAAKVAFSCPFLCAQAALVELLGGHLVVAHPGEAHIVDRPLAKADPIVGIGVGFVADRVVVPADDMQDRSGRQQRLHIVFVQVNDVPSEIVFVDAAQSFDFIGIHAAAGIDSFQAHPLAAIVHVRLIRNDARRLGEGPKPVGGRILSVFGGRSRSVTYPMFSVIRTWAGLYPLG